MYRLMTPADLDRVDNWWKSLGCRSARDCYPIGSSYVYQIGANRAYAFALHFVQGANIAYIDGYIRNPDIEKHSVSADLPKDMTKVTQDFADQMCKERGVTKLFGSTNSEKLMMNYLDVGYLPITSKMSFVFTKEIT